MLKYVSLMCAMVVLFSCKKDGLPLSIEAETMVLKEMVNSVSHELYDLGFPIDTKKITVVVKGGEELARIFNSISGASQKEAGIKSAFGPRATVTIDEPAQNGPTFVDGVRARLAFYDPNSKSLVFKHGATLSLTNGYLAHELGHVYQDQTFGLANIWQRYQSDPSREHFNITNFLVEGYAELVRHAYEQHFAKDMVETSTLSVNLGKIVESECAICDDDNPQSGLAYEAGLRFLSQAYQKGGWDKVDNLLINQPRSSEQILHPDKFGIDEPNDVSLAEWQDNEIPALLLSDGTMGEAYLFTKLLKQGLSAEEAFQGASGWDGDTGQNYKLYNNQDIFIWRIAFDRTIDAQQTEMLLSRANQGDKTLRVGRVLDWIISDDAEAVASARNFLSRNPLSVESNIEDEVSTQSQEISARHESGLIFRTRFRPQVTIEPKKNGN